MTNTDNIVDTLISQHRALQADLGLVAEELEVTSPDGAKITSLLTKFTDDVKVHLTLENDTFYVELLKQMKERGEDTHKTEEFIAEMSKIGEAVMAFIGKYSSADTITSQIEAFKTEFTGIVSTLNMRIESEENGVYLYWKS